MNYLKIKKNPYHFFSFKPFDHLIMFLVRWAAKHEHTPGQAVGIKKYRKSESSYFLRI